MLRAGLVGLPNIGKTILFNALTGSKAEVASYSFSTTKPNIGRVNVPDARLDKLAEIYNPKKYTPTAIEFVDLAGLVRGSSQGEGMGNQFLSHIRQVDAVVHIVRCFEDENIPHVDDSINPLRDMETIDLELVLADLDVVEKRLERMKKQNKGQKGTTEEQQALENVLPLLQEGQPARLANLNESELFSIKSLGLLTLKPTIYVLNVDETDLSEGINSFPEVCEYAKTMGGGILAISAQLDYELLDLEEEDQKEMLADLGLTATGLDRMIQSTYHKLDLITFLTAGESEVRAWTIPKGTFAQRAARESHSDIERGFIRAETVSFDELVACGSEKAAKEKGVYRLEGKEYVVQDGDVINFRFAV